jgi:maleate isomerase
MANNITDVTKDILPDQKIDCVAYGCTSGTIAAGFDVIEKNVKLAKPQAKVTTPITSAIKALKAFNVSKISVFTPYTKSINDSVINYFNKENITVNGLTYFDIESDLDIGKVDEEYLFEVLSKIDLEDSEALFVSCTALPVLSIIDKLEKKMNKVILSSNQTLIWESLKAIGYKNNIEGFGKLFKFN